MNNRVKNDRPRAGVFPEELVPKVNAALDRILTMREKQIGQPMMFAASQPIPDGYIQIPTDWIEIAQYPALYEAVKDRAYVETRASQFKVNHFNLSNPLPGGGEVLIPTAGLAKDGVLVLMKKE